MFEGLKELIEKSKNDGFILKADFLEAVPTDIEQDQADRIIKMLSNMGIELKDNDS